MTLADSLHTYIHGSVGWMVWHLLYFWTSHDKLCAVHQFMLFYSTPITSCVDDTCAILEPSHNYHIVGQIIVQKISLQHITCVSVWSWSEASWRTRGHGITVSFWQTTKFPTGPYKRGGMCSNGGTRRRVVKVVLQISVCAVMLMWGSGCALRGLCLDAACVCPIPWLWMCVRLTVCVRWHVLF